MEALLSLIIYILALVSGGNTNPTNSISNNTTTNGIIITDDGVGHP